MATIASRITSDGTLLVNGDFDEWTGAPVVDNSLVLWLDAGQETSYPGNGTTWTSIASVSTATTLINGPTFSASNGGIISFDGIDDYVSFTAPNMSTSVSVATVEMWVKIKGTGARMPFGFTGYDVYLSGGNMGYNTGGGDSYGIPAATVTSLGIVGNWKHLVFVMQNNTSLSVNPYTNNKIYVDGVVQSLSQIVATQSGSTRTFNNGVGRISGWNNDSNYRALMDLAVFKIYNRELTAEEIQKNYNALDARYSLTPIANVNSQVRTKIDTVLASEFDEVTFNNTSPAIKNLLTNTERFELWANSLNIITTNATTAPNGTLTADRIQVNNTGYTAILNIDTVGGASYTFSFYVKSVSGASGTWAVNYYNGAHNRSTVPITGEWTRQYITFTGTGAQVNVYIADNRSLLATLTDAYVWGAQLERGTVPTIYQGISDANTLVNSGFAKRETSDGSLYVTDKFDEVTGMIVTTGLVAYYDAGKAASQPTTGATWYDISNTMSNATPSASPPTYNSSGYFTFDRVNVQTYRTSALAPTSWAESWTIEVWMYTPTGATWSNGVNRSHFISAGSTAGTWGVVRYPVDNQVSTWIRGAAESAETPRATLARDTWNQFVGTWNSGNTISSYLNGAFVGSATVTPTGVPDSIGSGIHIGGVNTTVSGSPGTYYEGNIAIVTMYNRALSAAEVANNFEALRDRFGI